MTTLKTNTTTEYRKRVYFDGSPTRVFNEKCLTPLMIACMYGRAEQVKLILEEKVSIILCYNSTGAFYILTYSNIGLSMPRPNMNELNALLGTEIKCCYANHYTSIIW